MKNLKDCLYEPFKKWAQTGAVWIYSDPHFSDIESYCFRFGCNVNDPNINNRVIEFDKEQIKSINKEVTKNDTIIFLGDIGNIECIKSIRGYKVLITGNHDRGLSYYKEVFNEVYDGPLMINDRIILSHEPIKPLPSYMFNIHGHDHSGTDFMNIVPKYFDCDIICHELKDVALTAMKMDNCRYLNCCAEWIGYSPVNLSSIIKSGILKNIKNIHKYHIDNRNNDK